RDSVFESRPSLPQRCQLRHRLRSSRRNESFLEDLFETKGDHRQSQCVLPPVPRISGSGLWIWRVSFQLWPYSRFKWTFVKPISVSSRFLRGVSFYAPNKHTPLGRSSDAGNLD